MIKLNLLPSYVIEKRRIRTVIVVFLILIGVEAGVVFKAYADLQAVEKWFKDDAPYFTKRADMINAEKTKATTWETQAKVYEPYISFFTRGAVIDYTNGIATSLAEAGKLVGGGKAWFDKLTITGNAVEYEGHIKGLMEFVNFYFKAKASTPPLTVEPLAIPAPSPSQPTMNQEVVLKVKGTVTAGLPAAPGPVGEAAETNLLYHSASGAAPEAGAAAGAPAGAPAAAPAGGPGK